MSEEKRLRREPPPEIAYLYEQRGDECWYPKPRMAADITMDNIVLVNLYEGSERSLDPGPGKVVAVGDLHSTQIGSGARMNADKPAVDLIPVRHWVPLLRRYGRDVPEQAFDDERIKECLETLARFQEGAATGEQLLGHVKPAWYMDAVAVFEYGKKKYAAWNWLKGMPWSVPLACAVRHAVAIIIEGEDDDPESGLPHIGHFVCNLIMLATYYETYPEGNDLPPSEYFGHE